jgi:hypothetical protein
MKKFLMILLMLLLGGCTYPSDDAHFVSFLVHKDGEKLIPIEKILFSISTQRQEVIYCAIGANDSEKDRTELFKLKECKVLNKWNWEGLADFKSPLPFDHEQFPYKFEVAGGKFKSHYPKPPEGFELDQGYFFVGRWTWYFKAKNLGLSDLLISLVLGYLFGDDVITE